MPIIWLLTPVSLFLTVRDRLIGRFVVGKLVAERWTRLKPKNFD